MRIVISPFSRKLRTDDPNRENAKHYAHWERLLRMIKEAFADVEIIQVGVDGEKILPGVDRSEFSLSFREVAELIKSCDLWISIDNFLPHLCNSYFGESKPGIVIFTRSDPSIYGYAHNFNILKSRKYLRPDQFGVWESCSYDPNSSPDPETVLQVISRFRLEDSF
jgi:ADP-heptose:LPS heptosyltransferase